MSTLRDALTLQSLGCPVTVTVDGHKQLIMSWETGRLFRLLATHPDRTIDIPEWAIPEWDVITGRKQPIPITPPRPETRKSDSFSPLPRLEDALTALGSKGCRPQHGTEARWRAQCPLCRIRGRYDLRVQVRYHPDTATASLHCFSTGHTDAELLAALELAAGPAPLAGRAEWDYVLGEGSHV